MNLNVLSNEKVMENYTIKFVVKLLFKSVSTAVYWFKPIQRKNAKTFPKLIFQIEITTGMIALKLRVTTSGMPNVFLESL